MDADRRGAQRGDARPGEQEMLVRLLEATADKTGPEFFRALVEGLAKALGVSGAWVTDYLADQRLLKARAFWLSGKWIEDFAYSTPGTPCASVVEQCRVLHVPERVIELYPEDPDLARLGAVSYTGMPITDSDGAVIGNLATIDVKPQPETARYLGVFRVFAQRAAAEMRRLNAEARTAERERRLARLIDGAMDGIVDFDASLRIRLMNRAADESFGVDPARRPATLDALLDRDAVAAVAAEIANLSAKPEAERRAFLPGRLGARTPDGRAFEIEATLSENAAAGAPFYTLIFRDVAARIEAERRIERLEAEASYLRAELGPRGADGAILGRSAALAAALETARQVAATDATVLLLGESGTGKELFAHAIHQASARAGGPLVKVNCAAIPAELVESEFFGHEKGAFTGATRAREGRFALADGGTIFLDEVGELPLALQAKLLRVLQSGEFEPVGAERSRRVDVRVIAATNRDLAQAVRERNFREDLYYRLNVVPIRIPPLRERGEDAVLLAEQFRARFARQFGRAVAPLTDADRRLLAAYPWPGNVRELENVIERAVITAKDGRLDLARLLDASAERAAPPAPEPLAILTDGELRRIERDNIARALAECGWKVAGATGAARRLGLSPSTLASRMKALGIARPKP